MDRWREAGRRGQRGRRLASMVAGSSGGLCLVGMCMSACMWVVGA